MLHFSIAIPWMNLGPAVLIADRDPEYGHTSSGERPMSFCAQSARGPTQNTEAGSRISIPFHPHASMVRNAFQQADQSTLTVSRATPVE
ncbi:hypothetical protein AAFG13_35645 [Bradyrhizobium sp. B124]|uniref:hypothetical protein n=1 Tax=Bradyrhizobium sp. B124 TaxID=3140245 RepID=UPI0031836BC4